jgi:hypothetical protein
MPQGGEKRGSEESESWGKVETRIHAQQATIKYTTIGISPRFSKNTEETTIDIASVINRPNL